jgi:hypothetical protein
MVFLGLLITIALLPDTRVQKKKERKKRDTKKNLSFSSRREDNILSSLDKTQFSLPPPNYGCRRLSQRVAMDDLASYFVEERSKVR